MREDRPIFCASVSSGLRSSSGPKSALRTFKERLALASGAHGSAEPSASASSPVPEILALSRNAAPHAPVAVPSNCAGPSPAATVRLRPSSASKVRPCPEDNFVSIPTSLRPSAPRSMPWIAATAGFAVMMVVPLSCGASRSTTARTWARSACPALLSRSSASFRRAGPGIVPIASSRAASDGANGAIKAVNRPSDAALESSASFPDALTRSKLPMPSSVTLSGWPIFNWSSDSRRGDSRV